MKLPIYMDYQSTTPVDPRVLAAMLPYHQEEFGNAASRSHSFGLSAHEAVEAARTQIARLIHAQDPEEIVFTSGATESNNLAIKGVAAMYREKGDHVITSVIEHKSVLDACQFLGRSGYRVTFLGVNREGIINLEELRRAIEDRTILISIMHANNEIGVLQPVEEVGRLAKARGIFFHSDVAQSAGKVPVDVQAMGMDLASLSGHKLYGPKGIGALYVRKRNPRVRLTPLIHGGGHEGGLRSGTLNVAGAVGFGRASEVQINEMDEESARISALREKLRKGLTARLSDAHVNGGLEKRLPGNLNMSFEFVEGGLLLQEICKEIAVSSGSACSSAHQEPSYVLEALGVREELIHTSIRFSLGRFTTEEEVDFVVARVVEVVRKLRAASTIYASGERD